MYASAWVIFLIFIDVLWVLLILLEDAPFWKISLKPHDPVALLLSRVFFGNQVRCKKERIEIVKLEDKEAPKP